MLSFKICVGALPKHFSPLYSYSSIIDLSVPLVYRVPPAGHTSDDTLLWDFSAEQVSTLLNDLFSDLPFARLNRPLRSHPRTLTRITIDREMPPAPSNNKPTRSSIYAWAKKRSVSPSAPLSTSTKSKPAPQALNTTSDTTTTTNNNNMNVAGSSSAAAVPARRLEESPYFEEDYSDEIQQYMHTMDVSIQISLHRNGPLTFSPE